MTLLVIGIAGSATYAIYQDSVSRREQGLKLVSDAYELLYRDPSLAFLKAFRASTLLPEPEARPALNDAYKVAVLHHYNRREIAQLTGSGPTYLAGRWKQGQIFSEASPDGRYRLIVTERGRDGWPTGEVYLLNNESLRVIKLGSCIQNGNGRVEDVGFDSGSKNVFVSRNFNVSAYSLTGQCVGRFELSCCTKSPVHLVEGYLDDRFLIVAETKGGLWLVDKGQTGVLRPIVLQPEFHGDPAVSATLSPDGQNAAVVFESGRVAIIDAQQCIVERVKKEHCFRDLSKENALFANFYPGEKDRVVTAGRDGVIRHWQISQNEVKETERQSLPGVAIDWVAFSNESSSGEESIAGGNVAWRAIEYFTQWLGKAQPTANQLILVVGDNNSLYVISRPDGRKLLELNGAKDIDWASARAMEWQPADFTLESVSPSSSVPYPDPKLALARILQTGGRTWLVTEKQDDWRTEHTTYLVDGAQAVTYPGFDRDTQKIEQYGDFVWLRGDDGVGPFVRVDGNRIVYCPNKNLWVKAVVSYQGKTYLGTNRGLYTIESGRFSVATPDDIVVNALHVLDGRLWVASEQGAYVLDKGQFIRVSEPFVNVRAVKQVGADLWLLTKINDFNAPAGPAYLEADYLSRPLPSLKAHITDVIQVGGKTWLLGMPGLYLFNGQRATEIGPIAQDVVKLREENGALIASTEVRTFPFSNPGPDYEIDLDSLKASAVTIREAK